MQSLITTDWSHPMNSHLNYLMATQRHSELARVAQRARLAGNDEAIDPGRQRDGRSGRFLVRLRLSRGESQRLSVRRA
jgi:hypothetical protein